MLNAHKYVLLEKSIQELGQ